MQHIAQYKHRSTNGMADTADLANRGLPDQALAVSFSFFAGNRRLQSFDYIINSNFG